MRSFKDRSGKDWPIGLTVGAVKRVKDETGVDLLDLTHHERAQPLIEKINGDPFILCEVIFSAVQPTITKEVFAEGLDGDAIEAAAEALWGAITDFTQSHRRPLMAKVLEKVKVLHQKQATAVMAILDDPRMDQMLAEMLKSGLSSTASPVSSALTPEI
jgi:uncharacterized protein (DUF1778 family)